MENLYLGRTAGENILTGNYNAFFGGWTGKCMTGGNNNI